MSDSPRVTIHIGPQTALGRALNDCARLARKTPRTDGRLILPNRIANRMARHLLVSSDPLEDRQAAFHASIENDGKPVYLSFLHALDAPQTAFQNKELYPDVEITLARLSALLGQADMQIVVTLDALHRFFLAAASDPLDARLRVTPWDVLYELSWAELMEEIRHAFGTHDIIVLTPKAAALQSAHLLHRFFGAQFSAKSDAQMFLRLALSAEGQNRLDGLEDVTETEAEGLLAGFPAEPDPGELRQRLGIDSVTADLLDQRFEADMDLIEEMRGVTVL